MAPKKRRYGWRRDSPDMRDARLRLAPEQVVRVFPSSHSLRAMMPEVDEQIGLGACTAHSIKGLLQYREMTDENHGRLVVPSRLFVYYNARVLEGTVREDSGVSIRTAIKAVVKWGVCDEAMWGYSDLKKAFTKRPPQECYDLARKYRVTTYGRVQRGLLDLKAHLLLGDPVAFGFAVYDSFESEETTNTGIVKMPNMSESCMGGHAVLLVGWDDARQSFEVRNSWGSGWGDKGYCWMPYGYVTNHLLCDDFWTMQAIP